MLSPFTMWFSPSSAVMKMMGICAVAGFSFNLCAIWNPEMLSIITSRSISLYSVRFSANASSAELAVTTS